MELIVFAGSTLLAHLLLGAALRGHRVPRYFILIVFGLEALIAVYLLFSWRVFILVWLLANGLMLVIMQRASLSGPQGKAPSD